MVRPMFSFPNRSSSKEPFLERIALFCSRFLINSHAAIHFLEPIHSTLPIEHDSFQSWNERSVSAAIQTSELLFMQAQSSLGGCFSRLRLAIEAFFFGYLVLFCYFILQDAQTSSFDPPFGTGHASPNGYPLLRERLFGPYWAYQRARIHGAAQQVSTLLRNGQTPLEKDGLFISAGTLPLDREASHSLVLILVIVSFLTFFTIAALILFLLFLLLTPLFSVCLLFTNTWLSRRHLLLRSTQARRAALKMQNAQIDASASTALEGYCEFLEAASFSNHSDSGLIKSSALLYALQICSQNDPQQTLLTQPVRTPLSGWHGHHPTAVPLYSDEQHCSEFLEQLEQTAYRQIRQCLSHIHEQTPPPLSLIFQACSICLNREAFDARECPSGPFIISRITQNWTARLPTPPLEAWLTHLDDLLFFLTLLKPNRARSFLSALGQAFESFVFEGPHFSTTEQIAHELLGLQIQVANLGYNPCELTCQLSPAFQTQIESLSLHFALSSSPTPPRTRSLSL